MVKFAISRWMLYVLTANTAEKNVQVGIMFQIYSQADYVDAWLGPAANGSDILMSKLEEVGARAHAAGIMDPDWSSKSRPGMWWVGSETDGPSLEPRLVKICDALNELSDELAGSMAYLGTCEFADREYWSRVWVLQEFVVPRRMRFVCGAASLSFQGFTASVLFQGWHALRQRDVWYFRKAVHGDSFPEQTDTKSLQC